MEYLEGVLKSVIPEGYLVEIFDILGSLYTTLDTRGNQDDGLPKIGCDTNA